MELALGVDMDGAGVRVDEAAVGAYLDGGVRHMAGRLLKLVRVLLGAGVCWMPAGRELSGAALPRISDVRLLG